MTKPVATVSVRYIVHDVDAAIAFYEQLGFRVEMYPASAFAMLSLQIPGGGEISCHVSFLGF